MCSTARCGQQGVPAFRSVTRSNRTRRETRPPSPAPRARRSPGSRSGSCPVNVPDDDRRERRRCALTTSSWASEATVAAGQLDGPCGGDEHQARLDHLDLTAPSSGSSMDARRHMGHRRQHAGRSVTSRSAGGIWVELGRLDAPAANGAALVACGRRRAGGHNAAEDRAAVALLCAGGLSTMSSPAPPSTNTASRSAHVGARFHGTIADGR